MKNSKAWTLAIIFGIIGIILSAVILILIMLKTGYIIGIVTVLGGALSGGAAGLGYKLGNGNLKDKSEVQTFLWILTGFGFLGVLAAYIGPYFVFFSPNLGFSLYISLIGFDYKDVLFLIIGALGGRWAGERIARSIIISNLRPEIARMLAQQKVKKGKR